MLVLLGWLGSRQRGDEPTQTAEAPAIVPPAAQPPMETAAGISVTPPAPPLGPLAAAATAAVPATRFRDCDDPACPWLVVIGPGSFTMGSPLDEKGRDDDEGPQRTVRIGYRLAMTETEITRGQFRAFVEATKHDMSGGCWVVDRNGDYGLKTGQNWLKPGFEQTDDHPVVCVSWNDAQVYARWLNQRTGQRYRLPSEAEWEHAARAGTTTRYSFGDDETQLCAQANVADQATKAAFPKWNFAAGCSDGHAYTAPVRSFEPNPWGLYDMHGNAWEWVQDCKAGYKGAPTDGSAVEPRKCELRLLRGGAWNSEPRDARSAFRNGGVPADRIDYTGLRLTRMLP